MKTKTVFFLNRHIEVDYCEDYWWIKHDQDDDHGALLDKLLHDYYDTEMCDLIYDKQ